eukprot:TRINITY_DN3567_c0_g1_i2.p1 TRINITY_DN3567_c0_g1~~TRINITY_DN3567_c0_g1_i2.p1  ORF type:complete len:249 (+),score=65.48 TRINITY_DN3567_c0_g1_i2:1167-1913(+)
MTSYLDNMKIGDSIDISKPISMFTFPEYKYKHIGLIAGGTGITQIIGLLRQIEEFEPKKIPSVSLIYANKTVEDILLLDEIKCYVNELNIDVHLIVENESNGNDQDLTISKYIEKHHLKRWMPPPGGSKIFICGPVAMEKKLSKYMKDLYPTATEDYIYAFTANAQSRKSKAFTIGELPKEEDCCNQHCPNCVWITYVESLMEYAKETNGGVLKKSDADDAIKILNEKVSLDPSIKSFLELELKLLGK